MLLKALMVGIGGALGAISRFTVSHWMTHWFGSRLPFGTFTVNMLGSFCMGFLFALVQEKIMIQPHYKLLLMVGFLGSFTTFSSFALDNALLSQEQVPWMLLNIITQNLLGIALVFLGIWSGRFLAG